jgi:hypothetical protein
MLLFKAKRKQEVIEYNLVSGRLKLQTNSADSKAEMQ